MTCEQLEPLMEALADGTVHVGAEEQSHLAACANCRAALERARRIDQWCRIRDVPVPSPTFTFQVMALIERERWRTERFFDLGFNVVMAVGVAVMLTGGVGLAWALGLLSITLDVGAMFDVMQLNIGERLTSQMQTLALAAMVLTLTLALWWWTEADQST